MQNIILRNQKQIANNFPNAQLGSRFAKLADRFAHRTYQPTNHTQFHEPKDSQLKGRKHHKASKTLCSLENEQLQFFKNSNIGLREQNKQLKQQVKVLNDKLEKTQECLAQISRKATESDNKVRVYQKKTKNLLELSKYLFFTMKSKLSFTQAQASPIIKEGQTEGLKQQFAGEAIEEFDLSDFDDQFSMELKDFELEKLRSIHHQRQSGTVSNTAVCSVKVKQTKQSSSDESHNLTNTTSPETIFGQHDSLMSFSKILSNIFSGDQRSFDNSETLRPSNLESSEFGADSLFSNVTKMFEKVIEANGEEEKRKFQLCSKIGCAEIIPTYSTMKLYDSLKEAYDFQIYQMEKQKMEFLEYKNKRLLRFLHECNGCERYEEMINQIFRIVRESMKEVKCKISSELVNREEIEVFI